MDFTNPVLTADWPEPDVGLFAAARPGVSGGRDHVAFGGVSVGLVGGEEVAA
jgi:hypothetical protein